MIGRLLVPVEAPPAKLGANRFPALGLADIGVAPVKLMLGPEGGGVAVPDPPPDPKLNMLP